MKSSLIYAIVNIFLSFDLDVFRFLVDGRSRRLRWGIRLASLAILLNCHFSSIVELSLGIAGIATIELLWYWRQKLIKFGWVAIAAVAIVWTIPNIPATARLLVAAIFACIGLVSVTAGRSRLKAWVMVGIMLSTIVGYIHLDSQPTFAATETIPSGAYIIDMGQPTQTVANGLKPYGLVYELVVKNAIPVKWAIDPNKIRDGIDFTANGKTYKGGSFIITPEYATNAATTITAWKAQGVIVDGPIASSFTAPIYETITNFPNAVLDFANGSIAQTYYTNAGIPASTTGPFGSFNTYRFGYPSSLNTCDDIFVMPHADPTWANHSNLLSFVQTKGFIWAACHAVSVLERIDDPGDSDTLPDLNFLSHIPPLIQDSKSLKLFGAHALPTIGPYQYATNSGTTLPYGYSNTNLAAYPIMQFLGKIDTATQNGSEQIYIPDVGAQWRNETAVAIYDQNNTDAVVVGTATPPTSQQKAAKMVFGSAFGNPNNGIVMYEAGHSHAKAALPDNIAAQRAFLNLNLLSGLVRGIRVNIDLPTMISPGVSLNLATSNGGNPAVNINGGSGIYNYQWYSSCGGTFSSTTAQNPIFTPPTTAAGNCTLRVVVKDGCNHRSFGSDVAVVTSKRDISITKNNNITDVYKGQTVGYTITVKNHGTVPIVGVQISDFAFNGGSFGNIWNNTNSTLNSNNGNGSNVTINSGNDSFYGRLERSTYDGNLLQVSNVSLGNFKRSNGTATTQIDLLDSATPTIYNWTDLNLAPGQSATLTLTGIVNKDDNKRYIANFITAQPIDATNNTLVDDEPNNNRYYDADKIIAPPIKKPDLRVTKTHSPATPKPGDNITYTITIQNLSSSDDAAADVSFNDLVPSSISNVSWSCVVTEGGLVPGNTSCETIPTSHTGNNISYGVSPAIAGMKLSKMGTGKITTLTLTVNGTVTSDIGNGTIINTATVAPKSGDGDIDTSNNTAIDSFTIPTTDLKIAKSDGQTTAIAGTDVSYQIMVENNGPNTVTGFNIQEILPPELTLKTPSFSNVSNGSFSYDANTSQGSWTGLNLKSGESIALSFDTKLKPDAVGTLQGGKYTFTNTVAILTTGITGLDASNNATTLVEVDSSNNSSVDTDEIVYQSDLAIVKSDGISFAKQNDTNTYTLKVTNNGPSWIGNASIVDRSTKNSLTATSWGTPSQGTISPTNPSFTYDAVTDRDVASFNWLNLNLYPSQSATVTLNANIAMANGNLSNMAIVSVPANYSDPNPGNDRSEDIDGISTTPPTIDLVIQKTNNQTIATPGQVVTYEILIINKSTVSVDNIKVVDVIPSDLIDTSLFATSGNYDPVTGLWTNIYLAPNGDDLNPANTPDSVVKLILEGTVKSSPTAAKLINTAIVEPPADLKLLETNTTNNIAIDEDNYPVTDNANLLLVKRITAVNGNQLENPNDNTPLNVYQDSSTGVQSNADNHPKWPNPINTNSALGANISTFLKGAIDGGKVKPGDAIEYTIYYLNGGGKSASSVKICDRLTDNLSFVDNSYGTDMGIQLQLGQNPPIDLTNVNDSTDRGQFIPALGPVPSGCNLQAANNNGTIAIDLTGTIGNPNLPSLPNATSPGTPVNAFGSIRFIAKVK
jgi:uncharacterized repeat protein (TIGR01451 family)